MTIKCFILVTKILSTTTDKIPDVGILSHYAQSQPFTTATDNEGWVGLLNGFWFAIGVIKQVVSSIKIRSSFRPHAPDHFTGFGESSNALCWSIKWDSISAVLNLVPASPNTEIHAPMRNNIYRSTHICQYRRMTVCITCDH